MSFSCFEICDFGSIDIFLFDRASKLIFETFEQRNLNIREKCQELWTGEEMTTTIKKVKNLFILKVRNFFKPC